MRRKTVEVLVKGGREGEKNEKRRIWVMEEQVEWRLQDKFDEIL
jgi:hypothetical protein